MVKRRRLNIVLANGQSSNSQPQAQADAATESNIESQPVQGRRKARGPTRMLEVWDMPENERIVVGLDNFGRPIGDEGKTLTSFMGTMVRRPQFAPLNYLKWTDMPETYKEEMLRIVEAKFKFMPNLSDKTKKMLKENMADKWRQWKNEVKSKGYDESKTEEEIAANIPDSRVDESQYRALVYHWCSEEAQKISEINKQNRSKLEDLHCTGTKGFPRFIQEKIQKAGGVVPTRAQIYIDSRTNKNGNVVNENVAEVIEQMKKYLSEASTSQSSQSLEGCSWQNDVYSQVKGPDKRGRVRCMGKIIVSTKSTTSSSEHAEEFEVMKERLHGLEGLVTQLVSYIQSGHPNDQLVNILRTANRQVPDAASGPDGSTHARPSSSSSHQPCENLDSN